MYTLGAILLMSVVLGAVVAVIDSVLGIVKLKDTIGKIPVIGDHWGLLISCLMVWLLGESAHLAAGWGVEMGDEWMNVIINGAVIYGAMPLKDAVISMVGKGLRA